MFSLVVQMEVRPGSREECRAGMTATAEASGRDEVGCLRFDVCSVEGDENRFVLYELYTDAEAFAALNQAPHFLAWREIADRVLVGQQNIPGTLLATNAGEVAA